MATIGEPALPSAVVGERALSSPRMDRGRFVSIDLLRGLVILLMALDHARYYFSGARVSPEDMDATTLPLFFTRWVTHLCAPVFFLLTGASIYLSRERHAGRPAGRTLIALRGLWLIVLELTIVGFAWSFTPGHSVAGVIWSLGWAMLFVAALSPFPARVVAVIGIAMIAGHNLLDTVSPEQWGSAAWIWHMLHVPWYVRMPAGADWFVLFPLIPWIGVAALGYGVGPLFALPPSKRRTLLYWAGATMLAVFVLLRLTNLYGNPATPSIHGAMGDFRLPSDATWSYALIGLLNVEKYPPSLQYVLMTLGIAALLLAWYQRYDTGAPLERLQRWIHVFGLVPMFFYVLHLFVLHGMALLLAQVTGQPSQWLGWGGTFPTSAPDGYGYTLAAVYLATTVAAILLYFPCRAFARFKARHGTRWLSFI